MSELDVITALEILDTAVKIGLGALIAGFAAYFLAKLNHRQDLEKDSLKRRRELLEKVASDIENNWNTYRRFYLVSLEYIQRIKKHEDIPSGMEPEFQERSKAVMDSTDYLSNAISILLLLGENLVYAEAIKYAENSQAYMIQTSDPINAPELNKLNAIHNSVLITKDNIFRKLCDSYKKIGY